VDYGDSEVTLLMFGKRGLADKCREQGFLITYRFNARAVDRNSGQFKAPFNEINNETR
jgi:hypothetical protein